MEARVGIGERIRTARKRAGLSQEAVARRADMSVKGMGDIERGDIPDPHISSLRKIADALGVPVGELLGESVPLGARLAPRVARLEGLELGELRDRQRAAEERLPEVSRMVPFGSGSKAEVTDYAEYYDLVDEIFAIKTVLQRNHAEQSSVLIGTEDE